jgi:hypothetical protein
VPLSANVQTGSCGGAGSEGYLTFTTTTTSDVFITTHQAGTTDTVIYVRNCTCTGIERACNDNADGRTTSALRLTSLPAGTYNVIIDTKVPTSGTLPVDIYITDAASASDRCGNPTLIPSGATSLTGTTCGFGADYVPVLSASCDYTGIGEGEDRVYYFYLPTAQLVTVSACGLTSDYDTSIFMRSVCTDNTSTADVACNDDNCGDTGGTTCLAVFRSAFSVMLSPGLYYFFADGYGLGDGCSCGNFDFSVSGI